MEQKKNRLEPSTVSGRASWRWPALQRAPPHPPSPHPSHPHTNTSKGQSKCSHPFTEHWAQWPQNKPFTAFQSSPRPACRYCLHVWVFTCGHAHLRGFVWADGEKSVCLGVGRALLTPFSESFQFDLFFYTKINNPRHSSQSVMCSKKKAESIWDPDDKHLRWWRFQMLTLLQNYNFFFFFLP